MSLSDTRFVALKNIQSFKTRCFGDERSPPGYAFLNWCQCCVQLLLKLNYYSSAKIVLFQTVPKLSNESSSWKTIARAKLNAWSGPARKTARENPNQILGKMFRTGQCYLKKQNTSGSSVWTHKHEIWKIAPRTAAATTMKAKTFTLGKIRSLFKQLLIIDMLKRWCRIFYAISTFDLQI